MALSDIGCKLLQCNGQGWNIDIFIDEHIKTEYICCFCHNVCKDAVELSCDGDHDDDAIQLYCQKCLLSDISAHKDNCPIDNHPKPSYVPNRRSRGKINKAKVLCPNSSIYKGVVKGPNIVETSDEKEGINDNNNVIPASDTCTFKGCLSQLITHISECSESNLDSSEIQIEMIKMMQNDINIIKDENKIISKKYQELQNMVYKLQTTMENEQDKITKLQTENKNIMEQHKSAVNVLQNKINKLEKITKSQNDLLASFEEEKKEKEALQSLTLLSVNELDQLLHWLPRYKSKLTLLYKASKDGFDNKIYYSKISGKAPIVCIICSENDNVFGGYTEVQPDINKGDTKDLAAFIFLLRSNRNVQSKWTANHSASWTVRMQKSNGPIFGGDVFYTDTDMKKGHSLAKNSNAFNHPKDNSLFGGASDYAIVDVEVFWVQ
eukprot:153687_1